MLLLLQLSEALAGGEVAYDHQGLDVPGGDGASDLGDCHTVSSVVESLAEVEVVEDGVVRVLHVHGDVIHGGGVRLDQSGIFLVLEVLFSAEGDVVDLAVEEHLKGGGVVGDDTLSDFMSPDLVGEYPVGVLLVGDGSAGDPFLKDVGTGGHEGVLAGAVHGLGAVGVHGCLVGRLVDHGHGAVEAEVGHDLVCGNGADSGELDGVVIDLLQTDVLPLALALGVLGAVLDGDGVAVEVGCSGVEELRIDQHLIAVHYSISIEGISVLPGQALTEGDLPDGTGVVHLLGKISGEFRQTLELVVRSDVGTIEVDVYHVRGVAVTAHRIHMTVKSRDVGVDRKTEGALAFRLGFLGFSRLGGL